MKTSVTTKSTSVTKVAVAVIFLLAAGAAAFIIAPPLKFKSWRTPVLSQFSILSVAKAADSPSGAASPMARQVVGKFTMTAGNKDIALNGMAFNYDASFGVPLFELYKDSITTFPIKAAAIDKNSVKFVGLNLLLPANQTKTFYLMADTSSARAGSSLRVSIDNLLDSVISDAQVVNGLPINFGTLLY